MADHFRRGDPPPTFLVAVVVGYEGTRDEAEGLAGEVGRLLAPLNAQGRMHLLLTRRVTGDPFTYGDEPPAGGMRSREEVEARRELHVGRVVDGVQGAADPYAAAVGETTRAHELDWVLGRNDG